MIFEEITTAEEIFYLLTAFDDVFPHLKEKVSSYLDYSKKLAKSACVRKCILDGKVCGLLVFYANDLNSKIAYISLIGVFDKYRGRNIGKKILDYCREECRKKQMTQVKLEVDLDNERAIAFYEKNGFSRVENASDNSFYMIKDIRSKDEKN